MFRKLYEKGWQYHRVGLSQYLTNLMHKILFYNRFYFVPIVKQNFVHQVG